jgi:DNA-binding NarL/FixJ family response regulator
MAAEAARVDDRDMPTCVVVEDHEGVLDAVAMFLDAEGIEVVGRAKTAADATRLIAELKPDLAILDYRLPDSSGVQVARALSVASPQTIAVLYSGEATRTVVSEALASGIRAVVLKDSPPTTLLRALSTVLDGRRFVDPQLRRTR